MPLSKEGLVFFLRGGVATEEAIEVLDTLLCSDLLSDWSESLLGVLLLDDDDNACLVRSSGGRAKSYNT